jgi:hypothetical protein
MICLPVGQVIIIVAELCHAVAPERIQSPFGNNSGRKLSV